MDLFDFAAAAAPQPSAPAPIGPGAVLMRGRAAAVADALLREIAAVAEAAPFRRMRTPGGFEMSVAMTSCGAAGWVTDRRGYRYERADPLSGRPWPAMPETFRALARDCAAEAGYPDFAPDACLINRYEPGARMSLHQDRDEHDLAQPIVSVSLGLPCVFQFGGPERASPVAKHELRHGDVVVWGGPSRLFYHGVLRLKQGEHPATGAARYNLTFRKALKPA
ncbi:DNA oxidative demethylase AlkB [Camelimonas abortus]|uniref:DNA oxidative demethylase AlkB n=1 Tax=Camelimonas abortus TaxID=1017184 RepID=A0ABV7LBR6_9HYPH